MRILIVFICCAVSVSGFSQRLSHSDSLAMQFKTPPASAMPRVWWHWVNGNVTKEGITADLEWMKRVGIAGAQIFDVSLGIPCVVDTPAPFMTPAWKEVMRHAGAEAGRLGIELAMQTSGGWSESGSPWVKPEAAMKTIVWSDTVLTGGNHFTGTLSKPGKLFQLKDTSFYADIKLLAFRVPVSGIGQVLNLREKAQYVVSRPDAQRVITPAINAENAINTNEIVDLSSRMKQDGTLDWDIPPGTWKILRLGYSLTGAESRFSTKESRGLEVDKLSAKHVHDYIHQYLDSIAAALGPSFGKSFQYMLMDSWEAGHENWTEDMLTEFRKRRGYDPVPWLPDLTGGYIVGSADQSDRFLWDFRRTMADLVAEAHYGVITKYVQQRGLKGVYAEAVGVEEPTTGDGLQAKGQVTIPMGEFVLEPWKLPGGRETNRADLKEAASAAHIYNKGLAGAEAFTTTEADPWAQTPYDLKPYTDWAFSLGINRFMIHTSAAQPFTDEAHKPGITLGGAGQNFTRNNTWGEQSVAFNNYLSRCSYLLQQGKFVADLLYYYGEDAPVVVPYWKAVEPAPPMGYDLDWINTELLLNKLTVQNGKLILPDGMSYRLLVVPNDVTRLTLPVMHKLRELVAAGAILLAPRPVGSPTLTGYPASDDSVRAIADSLFGPYGGIRAYHQRISHPYGKGLVYSGQPVQLVLDELGVQPDFRFSQPDVDDTLVWIHRHIIESDTESDADIYFVANQKPRAMDFLGRFRVAGKEAELWNPDTGDIEPASYSTTDAVFTTVPLHLDPRGSVFVVFSRKTTTKNRLLPKFRETALTTVKGPWKIRFPPNWGANPIAEFDSLQSWTNSKDNGIKYFSGTATYSKNIEAKKAWFKPGTEIILDLGSVKEIAEVFVNGKQLGILWKPPFRVKISKVLKPGINKLEVRITNGWPNRLIGDEQPGVTKQFAYSLIKPFTKDSSLLESGLLGPVKIFSGAIQKISE